MHIIGYAPFSWTKLLDSIVKYISIVRTKFQNWPSKDLSIKINPSLLSASYAPSLLYPKKILLSSDELVRKHVFEPKTNNNRCFAARETLFRDLYPSPDSVRSSIIYSIRDILPPVLSLRLSFYLRSYIALRSSDFRELSTAMLKKCGNLKTKLKKLQTLAWKLFIRPDIIIINRRPTCLPDLKYQILEIPAVGPLFRGGPIRNDCRLRNTLGPIRKRS